MANWNEITERWLPLVEEMERLGFEDYAIPELYRAAEAYIEQCVFVKISNGDVWLIFPNATISIKGI